MSNCPLCGGPFRYTPEAKKKGPPVTVVSEGATIVVSSHDDKREYVLDTWVEDPCCDCCDVMDDKVREQVCKMACGLKRKPCKGVWRRVNG